MEVLEYGKDVYTCILSLIFLLSHSITSITDFIYLTTFAPVVYWIFLKNYFRYVLFDVQHYVP